MAIALFEWKLTQAPNVRYGEVIKGWLTSLTVGECLKVCHKL